MRPSPFTRVYRTTESNAGILMVLVNYMTQFICIPIQEITCISYHFPRAFARATVNPCILGNCNLLNNPNPIPP